MKKFLAANLLVFVFVLSGCSGGSSAFVPGTQTETRYESQWIGTSFSADRAEIRLSPVSDLERVMKMNSRAEKVDPKTGKVYLDKNVIDIYYEMHAGGDNGEVLITADRFNEGKFSAHDYLAKKYIEPIEKRYKGAEVSHKIEDEIALAGRTYSRLDITVADSGLSTTKRVYVAQIKDRIVNIAISYDNEEALKKLESGFSALVPQQS